MTKSKQKKRDTFKYVYKKGNKILHGGITNDLERREGEHYRIGQVNRGLAVSGNRNGNIRCGFTGQSHGVCIGGAAFGDVEGCRRDGYVRHNDGDCARFFVC